MVGWGEAKGRLQTEERGGGSAKGIQLWEESGGVRWGQARTAQQQGSWEKDWGYMFETSICGGFLGLPWKPSLYTKKRNHPLGGIWGHSKLCALPQSIEGPNSTSVLSSMCKTLYFSTSAVSPGSPHPFPSSGLFFSVLPVSNHPRTPPGKRGQSHR